MRLAALFAIWCLSLSAIWAKGGTVCLINVDGAIGPATASYISRAIDEAKSRNAECLVIQLNTPGGLLESTRTIVQKLLTSSLPVIVYVSPTGAAAASAGCFITLAADVAAMAPATTIGAAHPVALGGVPGTGEQKQDDTMARKLENFSVSYIESIAGKRNRNVEWAKAAVRESASITAEKALETKVIEIIAQNTDDLLAQLSGRVVHGKPLVTAGAKLVPIRMSAAESLFQMIWRPEVMFVLMLIAIYGLIGELTTPGAVLPGIVGAIALILALYMSAILPVNVAGLLLIGLSFFLFVIDVFAPTHGILTGGGIISFFVGSLMLFDRNDPLFRLSLGYIIPAVIATAAFFVFVVAKGVHAQSLPIKAGREIMLGKSAAALTSIDTKGGKVFVEGEYWNAISSSPIEQGQTVRVLGVEGLTLRVEPGPKL
jgi:membrane-bound serine protease (ClpP class)